MDADTPVDVGPAGRSGELPTLVDAASASGGRRSSDETRLARGTTLGRYVVLERIGSGGMGVVYAAYDPQLDRKVALKLLHAREERDGDSGGRARVLREAQAMARLSHPNVVAVHDVGVVDDTLFVAMEFVEGVTLGHFIAAGSRRWNEVLDVFEPAGRGLAAAHAAGLVHRDFKPDNVMIGNDGRVRVMDFGLARAAAEITTESSEGSGGSIVELSGVDRLTRTGALVGTPAYMAPELLAGGNADARSDQFAFCVALHRALYGTAP
ncbi:MAG TPA: serine/threonine-protein kinase, partial [Nannocystaceae bacterium]|nr:serine/threonine-protein kinase [Nannocystaceae bacterium]